MNNEKYFGLSTELNIMAKYIEKYEMESIIN